MERRVALYTDEMIYPSLAAALRARGYDVLSCPEAGQSDQGISDEEQLRYAASVGRAILTANVRDFMPLDSRWKFAGRVHAGIVLFSGIRDFGTLFRRVVAYLDAADPDVQHDTAIWL